MSRYSASPRQKTSPKAPRAAAPASFEHDEALFKFSFSETTTSFRLDFCRAVPHDNSLRRAND
jgi:hypothetical protein